jgi:superfamily II DNA or RNA helicase
MGEYKSEEAEALMNKPAITGDALSHYRKLADGKPALVFCTSVKHAHDVAAQFRDGGVAALALDGGTDRDIRRMAVSDFRRGAIRVLTSCSIFCEGFDCPGVHAGIMLRPTASEGLWKQMVGRILRPAPGKTHALIADHVNGSRMWGLPADPREWELTSDVVRRKKSAPPGVRVCDECFAASPARALVCIECGVAFKVKPRAVEEREGELVEVTAEELARKKERQMQGRASTRQQLLEIARIKGRNPAWVDHVLRGREAKARKKESA